MRRSFGEEENKAAALLVQAGLDLGNEEPLGDGTAGTKDEQQEQKERKWPGSGVGGRICSLICAVLKGGISSLSPPQAVFIVFTQALDLLALCSLIQVATSNGHDPNTLVGFLRAMAAISLRSTMLVFLVKALHLILYGTSHHSFFLYMRDVCCCPHPLLIAPTQYPFMY